MSLDKNNTSTDKEAENKKTDIMNMVIFIDKEKLPEDVRKMIEEHLPKDIKEQLKLSQEQLKLSKEQLTSRDKQAGDNSFDNKLFAVQVGEVVGNIYADKDKHVSDKPIDNNLFTIQTGEVVGNIYADKRKDINKQ